MTLRTLTAAVAAPVFCLLAASSAVGAAGDPGFVRIAPNEIHWTDTPGGHGAQFATVLGDPSKPGLYVMRAKFPPHVMDSPHWHSQDRYVTVLQGTWATGTGPLFDPAKAVALGPGSVMKHPAKGVHWDGSGSDQTVIVQIMGMGPVETVQVDPKAAQWVVVKP
ncbi:MAG: cupin domain-containing protein [Phenylobacterium sp.]